MIRKTREVGDNEKIIPHCIQRTAVIVLLLLLQIACWFSLSAISASTRSMLILFYGFVFYCNALYLKPQ